MRPLPPWTSPIVRLAPHALLLALAILAVLRVLSFQEPISPSDPAPNPRREASLVPIRMAPPPKEAPPPKNKPPKAAGHPAPPAARTPPAASAKKKTPARQAGAATTRIDAAYDNPRRFVRWLLSHGGAVVLLDAEGRPAAWAASPYRLAATPPPHRPGGIWRSADELISLWANAPPRAAHAAVYWPRPLWDRMMNALRPPQAARLQLRYRVHGPRLLVTRVRMITADGAVDNEVRQIALR